MKTIYCLCSFLFALLLLQACSNVNSATPTIINNPEPTFNIDEHLKAYDNLKVRIQKSVNDLANDPQKSPSEKINAAKIYFSKQLVDSIFHYWYGTTWDFNGHTDSPRQGDVACGYFVSTPLKHMGFPINRFRIAQQAAAVIIDKLCLPSSIKRYGNREDLFKHLETAENYDVFVLGLDYHVAYIVKLNDENYLIHSDFAGRRGVVKEKLAEAQALDLSNAFVIGSLSEHDALIKKWLAL